ncbi:DNA translocase FtsK [Roseiarcus fermentans]|uniref:DNA translocase FtsK n=1 Tax=Roseiarcus fermentans TaxID=1473586 RepID=A0A366ELE8_9HYPH|nr:DNA translocase FtsK [Roseiarcus fermentans]RBP02550.1 DNA translocase FtsK [Roseiarcus fermentans]
MRTTTFSVFDYLPSALREFPQRRAAEILGLAALAGVGGLGLALLTWSVEDPSLTHATSARVHNLLGGPGAVAADIVMQMLGLACVATLLPPAFWGWRLLTDRRLANAHRKAAYYLVGVAATAALASLLPAPGSWPLPTGLGGVVGDALLALPRRVGATAGWGMAATAAAFAAVAILALTAAAGVAGQPNADEAPEKPKPAGRSPGRADDEDGEDRPGLGIVSIGAVLHALLTTRAAIRRLVRRPAKPAGKARPAEPRPAWSGLQADDGGLTNPSAYAPRPRPTPAPPAQSAPEPPAAGPRVAAPAGPLKPGPRAAADSQLKFALSPRGDYAMPPLAVLAEPKKQVGRVSNDALEQNARMLEGVLDDFGVKGEIINIRPGPVVTLYELEPAPGVKSSRVIGLADDIARSMSAVSARVAVVQGRNAIGIELPNQRREMVYLRELLGSEDFEKSKHRLAIALGKTIGGEPVIVDLARMPHLLVAGTTGSGKSVAINTMILSLVYRLKPEQCRLIMVDPKMLELSTYDGIPHLLTPVVTDPKKAVVALKWAVREMEDRYKKMSKVSVRNIDGFNARVSEARAKGEMLSRTVQTGFDRETGEAVYEREELALEELPYIVLVVDEMADLMMVAGKDIEGAIQRLAQMARAAGIHLIMATQRPSVDVVTGTIKANFPTRISFQVTSKIDSRTILGEQGAEQLLGQGDMLYMAGGGRISRVHGPFVSDPEVEKVVAHLKKQGAPEYLHAITEDDEPEDSDDGPPAAPGSMDADESADYYDRAVAIVLRDRKVSTSYIQRRLSVGYNKAASLVERMEKEGVVSAPNHSGKREILVGAEGDRGAFEDLEED